VGSGDPNPVAEVADNDLALGRMVDAISHSTFWKSSAIFVVEDDTQNGVDHVDGHRGPVLVISPYSQEGAVNDTYYSQINMVRTIEQILGIAPMNQEDRAAEPMFNAFTKTADLTPFTAQPETIPLTQGVTTPVAQLGIPRSEWGVYEQWVAWSQHGHFNGSHAMEDLANPAQLNHLDWYSAHGWKQAYPGEKHILAPNQVPGSKLPADYVGG
jgi:hypothetical protein